MDVLPSTSVFYQPQVIRHCIFCDLPVFIVPTVLHLSDILFTLIGGYTEILWIVLLASFTQTALLLFAYLNNRRLRSGLEPALPKDLSPS